MLQRPDVAFVTSALIAVAGVVVAYQAWRHPVAPPVPVTAQRWRLVPAGECRPSWVGVHASAARAKPTIADDGWGDLPEYIERDHDEELRRRLQAAAATGGFLILVGDSSVGKTRSLYQAVRALPPDWRLLLPDDAAAIRAAEGSLPPRTVVWLDDTPTERYFTETGRGGLSRTDLLHLIDRDDRTGPIVVLDTLWRDRYQVLTTAPSRPAGRRAQADRWRDAREALALAGEPVEVADRFSPAELNRAAVPAATDRRLADALADTQFGVTQILAGAPELLARWRRADSYANAVITAAIDATRLGIHTPLTISLLEEAATGYLTDRQRAEAPTSWFPAALAYGTGHGKGTTAPLLPHPGATLGETNGYTVSDYLLQHASRERRSARVPASTWDAALSHIRDPGDTARLADSARRRLLYRYAIPLYRHAATVGDGPAAEQLADLLAVRGDLDGLRARADAGDGYAAGRLAGLLAVHGDLDGAAQILRADAGDPSVASLLAVLLAMHGDLDGAAQILRARADAGDGYAAGRLADLLAERGDLDAQILRARADRGDGYAAGRLRLADLLAERGDLDELQARADAGDWGAAGQLAGLLAVRGDLDGLRARPTPAMNTPPGRWPTC